MPRFLLDTNVLSEVTYPAPNRSVLAWFDYHPVNDFHLSTVVLGELRFGARIAPGEKRRQDLNSWINLDVLPEYTGRILPVDQAVAEQWAIERARMRAIGRTRDPIDMLIAATALIHGLIVATRNTTHFEGAGVELVNPWQFDASLL